MVMFKYNGKIWNPKNPEKKLKQLRISWDDVEIINEKKKPISIEINDITLFRFKNKLTNETISSIYDNLDHLKNIINIKDYDRMS